ncbi:hypothetical protein SLS62_008836 [Diatrype stigma]|uniref:Protein kinase domain-containing protein n=1 Tax=Diatrype stigma TaxID=117547 RepID=A0AAN9YMH0_9PEZI
MAPNIEILATDPSAWGDRDSFIRILYTQEQDGEKLRSVRYARILPRVFPYEWFVDPFIELQLPDFPSGDWCVVDIVKNKLTGHLKVVHAKEDNRILQPTPKEHIDAWHPISVEYVELKKVSQIPCTNYMHRRNDMCWLVTHGELFPTPVLMKIAEFPFPTLLSRVKNETTVYKEIEGKGIGPKFLGHVTENGRIIGFLMEYLKDAVEAQTSDYKRCEEVLKRFHAQGWLHRDYNHTNFLVQPDGAAKLIDFEYARRCSDKTTFARELGALEREFLHHTKSVNIIFGRD